MNRLWVKLVGAFAVVIVIGVIVTVLVARQAAATQFSHFMIGNRMVQPAALQQALGDYFAVHDSWDGIDADLPRLLNATSDDGMMNGGSMMGGGMMGLFDSRVRVADAQGMIVADSGGSAEGRLEERATDERLLIHVDGRSVGTLVIDGSLMTMPLANGATLLGGMTRAVLIAALAAGLVALALAAAVVRQITQPLAELGNAARRIAAGDLNARVEPGRDDELGDLARSFNGMAASLAEQEQLRRYLVADVAHELRTPLSGIQGMVEALQDGVFPLTVESLEPIHGQVTVLNRLVEDLRTLALAEAGELNLDVTGFDLRDWLERQRSLFEPLARESGRSIAFEFAPAAIFVRGDEQRLAQVLANLITNALRHTPATAEIPGAIVVNLARTEDSARLSVQDNGEGIAATALPHVFERFYRTDRSRSRRSGGSGLGLAIAKRIVEAHDGAISVESPPPGKHAGTRVTVELPIDLGRERNQG